MPQFLAPFVEGPTGWVAPLTVLTTVLFLVDVLFKSRQTSAILAGVGLTGWALYSWLTYGDELAIWTSGFAYVALLGGWKIVDARRRETAAKAAPALHELNRSELADELKSHSDEAIDGSKIGRWYWSLEEQRLQYSNVFVEITGFDPATVRGDPQEWYDRIHPCDLGAFRDAISAHLYGNRPMLDCEYRLRRADGEYRWMLTRGEAGRDADGRPVWMTGVQIDVTGIVDAEARADDQQTDRLTGLLNRRALALLLERACRDAEAAPGTLAVLALDLNGFKMVNDSLGLAVGDDALAAVGKRLQEACGGEAACGRQSGDEFAVVLENVRDPTAPLALARRIQDAMRRPFHIGRHELQLSVSIGAAIHGQAGVLPEELMRNAAMALQRAKAQGLYLAAFDENMRAGATRRYALRNELSRAAERAELELYYQPIYRLSDGVLVEAEALIRWRRSTGETVGAGELVALAEESGMIVALGDWVLRTACVARTTWLQEGHDDFRVAVNVSAIQLLRQGFPEQVERTLARTGAPAHLIEVELTESALLDNFDQAADVLTRLASLGLRLSCDDFGTGYSSLSYVTRLPFSTIKLDRSLVVDVTSDTRSRAVAQGLISLAHTLQMDITAEGVETAGQLHFLLAQRCDRAQGYLLAKPMPAWQFSEGLRSGALKRYEPIAANLSSNAPNR